MTDAPHEEIMRSIGRIEGKIDGINQRLDVLNGKTADQGKEIDMLKNDKSYRSGQWKGIILISGIIASVITFFLNQIL